VVCLCIVPYKLTLSCFVFMLKDSDYLLDEENKCGGHHYLKKNITLDYFREKDDQNRSKEGSQISETWQLNGLCLCLQFTKPKICA